MKIVAFEGQGGPRLGVVDGDYVVDLQAADPEVPADLGELLAKNNGDTKPLGEIAKRAPAGARKPLPAIKYALPVGRPGKIICLGLNYLEHVKEGSQRDPKISDDLHARAHVVGAARRAHHPAAGLRNARL